MARCGIELEKIYGIYKGNHQKVKEDNTPSKTQEELANELGVSQKHYQKLKKLLTLIPELQDLVSEEKLSPTVAYKV